MLESFPKSFWRLISLFVEKNDRQCTQISFIHSSIPTCTAEDQGALTMSSGMHNTGSLLKVPEGPAHNSDPISIAREASAQRKRVDEPWKEEIIESNDDSIHIQVKYIV